MKKQFNFYMSEECKHLIDVIRKSPNDNLQGLSDSQIVEFVIRSYASLWDVSEDSE